MQKTPLCDLLGIEVPIILAPMGSCTSAELAAAASNHGALRSIGSTSNPAHSVLHSPACPSAQEPIDEADKQARETGAGNRTRCGGNGSRCKGSAASPAVWIGTA
jgi:NAD(P)H-dependent flavin oxidoreductase YrpB (nitropropane dioxygenase family)